MRASPSSRRSSRSSTLIRGAAFLLLVLSLLPALAPSPAAAQNSSITINTHICPYGTDLASLDYYGLAAACNEPAVDFDYTINGPNYAQQVATVGGMYTASGLEPGTYYITQSDYSQNYGYPVAYCSVDDELGGDITVGVPTSVVGGSQSPIDLAVDGYNAFCDVFNVTQQQTTPTQGDAEVYISKWACDEGYSSQDYNDLQANCTTELEGVTFTIEDFADDARTDDTGGQPARASFTDWKTGGATITETIPQGYGEPVVYCYAQDYLGNTIPGYDLTYYPSTNGRISIDIPVDANGELVTFYCEWFNLYGNGGGDDADVFINKWECPEGYYSEHYKDLRDECTTELEGVDFTIEDENGGSATDDTGGQPARASFTPWTSGRSTITESIPDGYGEPIVFCWAYDDFGNYMPGYEPAYYPAGNGAISVDIPAPTGNYIVTFECDWYNLYENDYAGIYIHKYGCPQDWESSWTFDDHAENCLTIVRGAHYTVSGPDNYESEQATGGIDVWWEGLAPGEYEIREQPSQGYEEMAVWCAVGQYDGDEPSDYDSVDLSNGGFNWDLDGNEYLDCYWYNLPAQGSGTNTPRPTGPATIIIHKYTCEEDYDVFQTGANPTQECDEPTDGVTFTLQGGQNSSATSVTGEDGEDEGTATFEDVPAGSYLLKETYPEDVTSAFIWDCTSTVRQFDYPFSPFATIGPDGTIKVSVVAGETLECDWYDVPTGGPQTLNANVRVSVYDCPGSQVNTSQCDPAPSGVVVTLTSDDDEGTELETSDEGVASGGVDPGSYELDVDGTICFTDSDAFEQDGSLTVGEEPVTVDVYRCEA